MQQHRLIENERSLAAMVQRRVQAFSGNNALYINGIFYTYAGLWNIVLKMYSLLPPVKKNARIGIYCTDDVYTYAAILAVNLSGAAYVPLNKKNPAARNKIIVEACALDLILSAVVNEELKTIAGNIPVIDTANSGAELPEKIIEERSAADQDVCYILFTSGSTAEPKGVPVSNGNVRSFFNYYLEHYDFNERDRFLQVYELTFDVSVFSLFMPLLLGACCYVVEESGHRFMNMIADLQRHKITVLSMVPTYLMYLEKYLPEIRLPELRYSFFSGDALYHSLAVKWSRCIPNGVIHNFYGPTETTIVCTRYVFDEELSAKESVNNIVPLGKSFDGMEALIVDENNHPAPKGELCFTGKQVIAGYLNNAYAEQFFDYKGKRYYKTGDIAALNEQHDLVFYGRTDEQVKVNGYRIELKEVEAAIEKITAAKCVVMAITNKNNLRELCAFIAIAGGNKTQLIEQLSALLPAYMIPQEFIFIEEFPFGINGKVDKHKLFYLQKQE